MRKALFFALGLLFANSAYLSVSESPTLFHYTNVGLQVVLGALVMAMVVWLARSLRQLSAAARAVGLAILVAGISGLWLAWVGASRANDECRGQTAGACRRRPWPPSVCWWWFRWRHARWQTTDGVRHIKSSIPPIHPSP